MKKFKQIVSMTLAASMLLSTGMSLAVPSHSIVIGSKVFLMDQFTDPDIVDDVKAALAESSDIYYNLNGVTDDKFLSLFGSEEITEEQKSAIGKVEVVDVNGINIEMENFDSKKGKVKISTKEQLIKSVEHELVEEVELEQEIDLGNEVLELKKPVKLKLQGKKIKGNIEVKLVKDDGKVEIEDNGEGGIEGELSVETESVEVVLDAKVSKIKAKKEFKLTVKENAKIQEVDESSKDKIEAVKENGEKTDVDEIKSNNGKKPIKPGKKELTPIEIINLNHTPTGKSITIESIYRGGRVELDHDVNLEEVFKDIDGDKLTYSIVRHDGAGRIDHDGKHGGPGQNDNYEGMKRFYYNAVSEGENAEFGKTITVWVTANDGVNTSSPVAIKFNIAQKPEEPSVEVASDRLVQFEDARFEFKNAVHNRNLELLDGEYYVVMGAEFGPMVQKQITFRQGEAELLIDGFEFGIHGERELVFEVSKEEYPIFGEEPAVKRKPMVGERMPIEWEEAGPVGFGERMPIEWEEAGPVGFGERMPIEWEEAGPVGFGERMPIEWEEAGPVDGAVEVSRLSEEEMKQIEEMLRQAEKEGRFEGLERPEGSRPEIEEPVVARFKILVNIDQSTNHAPEFNPAGATLTVFAGIENEVELSTTFTDADGDALEIELVDKDIVEREIGIDLSGYSMKDGDTALFTPSVEDTDRSERIPFRAFDGKQYSEVSLITISIVSKEDMMRMLTEKIASLRPHVLDESQYNSSKLLLAEIDSIVATVKKAGVGDEELIAIEGFEKVESVRTELAEFEVDLDAVNNFEKSLSQISDRKEIIIINEETLAVENEDEIVDIIDLYENLSERAQNLLEPRSQEIYSILETQYGDALDAYEAQLDDAIEQMDEMYAGFRLENIDSVSLSVLHELNQMKARYELLPAELKSDLDEDYKATLDKFYGAIEALNVRKQAKLDEIDELKAVLDEEFTRNNFRELRTRVDENIGKILEISEELRLSTEVMNQYMALHEAKIADFDVFSSYVDYIEDMKSALNAGFDKSTGNITHEGAMEYLVTRFESISEGARAILTDAEVQDIERAIEAFKAFKAAEEEAKAQEKADLIAQIKTLIEGFTYELTPETIAATEIRHRDIYAQIISLLNPDILSAEELNNIAEYKTFLDQGEEIRIYSLNRRNAEEVVNEIKAQYVSDALTITPENISAVKAALSKYDSQSDEVKAVYTTEENAVVEGARAAVAEFEKNLDSGSGEPTDQPAE